MPSPAQAPVGRSDPPWPTPAECYLAALAPVTSISIGTSGTVAEAGPEETAEIVATVADSLITPIPPRPGAVAIATIGSESLLDMVFSSETLVNSAGGIVARRFRFAAPHDAIGRFLIYLMWDMMNRRSAC